MKLNIDQLKISLSFQLNVKEKVSEFIDYHKYKIPLYSFLVAVSVSAFLFYYEQGLTLSYNDARSHLNVARRVVDSLQPGFAQIGSVWLPLYHVLELPFIWNDFLWQSGIAGSIVSVASFILGGVYLIKLTSKLRFPKPAAFVSLMVYALNPNLLFMQTTPMTESLLIFLSIAATYHLVSWATEYKSIDIIQAAFFTFLTTLTRYDGWFLLAFSAVFIVVASFKKEGKKYAEGNFVLFTTLAGFGVFLWLLWNLIIFGDPLYFALGPFSAKSQQDIILSEGRLFSKSNIVYSTFLYLLTVIYNSGLWLGLVSLFGMFKFVYSKRLTTEIKLASLIILVPFVFNVFSLFAGHSVIHLPGLPPYTWFNDRYGLMMLPAVALFAGFLVKNRKTLAILVLIIILLENANMYLNNRVITIEDGVKGASGEFQDAAGYWMGENIDDGLILVAASSNDALLFRSGLPLKQFITEGARKHWDTSLEDPTVYADWIIMHKGDLVEQNLRGNKLFLENYELVYRDNFSYIYKFNENKSDSLKLNELPI